MKSTLLFAVALFIFTACEKDKFQTKPQLEIKSVNTRFVGQNQDLIVRIEFTDKEGDVSDSLFVVRERLNRRRPLTERPRLIKYNIPTFNNKDGEFEVKLEYQRALTLALSPIRIDTIRNEPDTLRLKFVAKDLAGNFSDTATVDDIIVAR